MPETPQQSDRKQSAISSFTLVSLTLAQARSAHLLFFVFFLTFPPQSSLVVSFRCRLLPPFLTLACHNRPLQSSLLGSVAPERTSLSPLADASPRHLLAVISCTPAAVSVPRSCLLQALLAMAAHGHFLQPFLAAASRSHRAPPTRPWVR